MRVRRPAAPWRARAVVAGVAFLAALPACGAILGIEAGTLDDAGAEVASVSTHDGGGDQHDATKPPRDAAGDAGFDVGSDVVTDTGVLLGDAVARAPDAASDAVVDVATHEADAHDASSVLRADGGPVIIYVDPASSATSPCGTQTAPCPTISDGLTAASQALAATPGTATIWVAQGSYMESITVPSGISIQGGFTATWTQPDGGDASAGTVITAVSGATVSVKDLVQPVTLSTLTLMGSPSPGPSGSVYGVFATSDHDASAPLTLDRVVVLLGPGGPGQPGMPGGMGPVAPPTCGTSSTPSVGVPGGSATTNGSFSENGFSPANGMNGGQGGGGTTGTAGMQVCNSSCWPGCGAFGCNDVVGESSVCAAGGAAGCGGGGGFGGMGGGGGGSSIALFAWNVPVTVKNGSLIAGNGGAGATGGSPGQGNQGSQGGAPATETCHASCTQNGFTCTNNDVPVIGNAGTVGGVGASGGMGGQGAGGSSYSVYWAGSSSPQFIGAVQYQQGTPGSGSVPGVAAEIGTPAP